MNLRAILITPLALALGAASLEAGSSSVFRSSNIDCQPYVSQIKVAETQSQLDNAVSVAKQQLVGKAGTGEGIQCMQAVKDAQKARQVYLDKKSKEPPTTHTVHFVTPPDKYETAVQAFKRAYGVQLSKTHPAVRHLADVDAPVRGNSVDALARYLQGKNPDGTTVRSFFQKNKSLP